MLIKREVPVLRLAELRRSAGDSALGMDEIGGVQRRATGRTLVPIGALILTARAGARDVAVSEELLRLGIVVLLALLLDEAPLVIDRTEDRRGMLSMRSTRRTSVDIKGDPEVCEGLADDRIVAVYDVLGADALPLSLLGSITYLSR